MKTREQAEARAMELYPKTHIATVNQLHEVSRDAFLQCWDEMQKHQNEERLKDVPKKYRDMPIEVVNKQTCGFCVEPKQQQKELLCEMMRKDEESGVYNDIDNGLRKAAEQIKKAIEQLEKALI